MRIFKVVYNPEELSSGVKNFIARNINPSMVAVDDEATHQYSVDLILKLEDTLLDLYSKDYIFLKYLEVEDIGFVEF
ncbi:MAG: hypothetical protein E6R13_10160 [Spirochaetes bacterium]|nr:MAG: hypothetical protein E6R13_10160 [Spirochaetota bacterium]